MGYGSYGLPVLAWKSAMFFWERLLLSHSSVVAANTGTGPPPGARGIVQSLICASAHWCLLLAGPTFQLPSASSNAPAPTDGMTWLSTNRNSPLSPLPAGSQM